MDASFTVTIGADQIGDYFRGRIESLYQPIIDKLDMLDAKLQQHIVADKLQGQVLNQVTGQLARSIEMIPATQDGDILSGSVQGGGGVAFYAKYQEYGTSGPYDITPSAGGVLAFLLGGKQVFAKKVTHPGLAPHSFMVSAMEDMRDEIVTGLQAVPAEVFA